MSALPPPTTPARGPSDRAGRLEGGSKFQSPGLCKKPTENPARPRQRKAAQHRSPPPSAQKRRLDEAGDVQTPAAKRPLQTYVAINERSSREPDVARHLDFSSEESEREPQDAQVPASDAWIWKLINGDIIEAVVKASKIPTWSKIPKRDQNAFASVLLLSIDKAMESGSDSERLEGWYEVHFLFHLLLRQTPTFSRDSNLGEVEKLKKADEIIHERLQQFKRGQRGGGRITEESGATKSPFSTWFHWNQERAFANHQQRSSWW